MLANVRYYDDLIVTHEDAAYMASHYELCEQDGSMYFVRTDPGNRCWSSSRIRRAGRGRGAGEDHPLSL